MVRRTARVVRENDVTSARREECRRNLYVHAKEGNDEVTLTWRASLSKYYSFTMPLKYDANNFIAGL